MSLIRQVSWDPWSFAPSRVFGQLIAPDFDDFLNLENSILPTNETGLSEVKVEKNRFFVNLDCHQFKPEELKVKLTDNKLIVHAKHEERKDKDGSYSKREFTRTYLLPQGCRTDEMTSKLTDHGILKIDCPREVDKKDNFKNIPIQHFNAKSLK